MLSCLHYPLATWLIGWLAFASARGQELPFAWHDLQTYRPPDFEGTFPQDSEASKQLEAALPKLTGGMEVEGDPIELFRRGLRLLRVDAQSQALSWLGGKFIWSQQGKAQDPRAIDLVYHAVGSSNPVIQYNALYHGLSVVRPMTEPILRAITEVAMDSTDPNVLSRIAWGGGDQKEELLRQLETHLKSTDPGRREHAEVLRKIFSGELKAFAWAQDRARDAAREKYSGRLEEIRQSLTSGDTAARKETLQLIQRERIELIMDESFIPAFAAAAQDEDSAVRKMIAVTAGSRWIWNATNQPATAVELMLRLSRDPARDVRYDSMYYGLSTIRRRPGEVVERMLEMTLQDGVDDNDFRHRITWGLESDRATLQRVLQTWLGQEDPIKALFAYGFHTDFFKQEPETPPALAELLQAPEKTVAQLLAFAPLPGWKGNSMDDFLKTLREELPEKHARRILWTNNQAPPFIMAPVNEVDGIKHALRESTRLKIAMELPLTVEAMIHIGKEGGFKTFKQR